MAERHRRQLRSTTKVTEVKPTVTRQDNRGYVMLILIILAFVALFGNIQPAGYAVYPDSSCSKDYRECMNQLGYTEQAYRGKHPGVPSYIVDKSLRDSCFEKRDDCYTANTYTQTYGNPTRIGRHNTPYEELPLHFPA